MQVVAYCEEKISDDDLKQDDKNILHFSLPGVLPVGYTLALNLVLGTLSCLSSSDGQPRLVVQQQFTQSELSLLLPLLQSFPHYCPYELLYASFYNGTVTEQVLAHTWQQLKKSRETGTWEQEMRPVRNVLSRTRLKLHAFTITISSILETGCFLRAMPIPKSVVTQDEMQGKGEVVLAV